METIVQFYIEEQQCFSGNINQLQLLQTPKKPKKEVIQYYPLITKFVTTAMKRVTPPLLSFYLSL